MGRIRQTIKVDGQECWTLFDTGARNTHVIPSVAQILKTSSAPRTIRSALGGGVRETNTAALPEAPDFNTRVGYRAKSARTKTVKPSRSSSALWQCNRGIRPIPDQERLDLSNYPEEFLEFPDLPPKLSCQTISHVIMTRMSESEKPVRLPRTITIIQREMMMCTSSIRRWINYVALVAWSLLIVHAGNAQTNTPEQDDVIRVDTYSRADRRHGLDKRDTSLMV